MSDLKKDREVIAAAGAGPGEASSYIARARTRYPELVDEVERLRRERDALLRVVEAAEQVDAYDWSDALEADNTGEYEAVLSTIATMASAYRAEFGGNDESI